MCVNAPDTKTNRSNPGTNFQCGSGKGAASIRPPCYPAAPRLLLNKIGRDLVKLAREDVMFQRISNSMKMDWLSFAVAVLFMSGIVAADSRKPNIIYIMADDKC